MNGDKHVEKRPMKECYIYVERDVMTFNHNLKRNQHTQRPLKEICKRDL